jgi:hypothetical protein
MASGSGAPSSVELVRVCFLAGGFEDKYVPLTVLHDAHDPVAALFSFIEATPAKWRVQDLENRVLGAAELRAITDLNTVIHLARRPRASNAAAAAAAEGAEPPSKRPRAEEATSSEEGGAAFVFNPTKWEAPPTYKLLDNLGADFPVWNAILEISDNALRAILLRLLRGGGAEEAPLVGELRILVMKEPNGKWCLTVRDNGVGLDAASIPTWATLGGQDGTARPTEHANPWHPDGNLHFYGVGGKCASLRLCTDTGYITVTSRKPKPGLREDVCVLQLNKVICKERAEAANSERTMFHMPGAERQPSPVEQGAARASDGGHWRESGVAVCVTDLDAELVHELDAPGGIRKLAVLLAETYHAYVHPQLRAPDRLPPLRGASASAAAEQDAAPMVRIFVGGSADAMIDVATLRSDDMISQMLDAGGTENESFELGIAIIKPDGHVTQARLRLFYYAFVNGHGKLPPGLRQRNVDAAHVIKLRCGRMLTCDHKPATLVVPQLREAWPRDGASAACERAKRAKAAARFLARVSGFIAFGADAEPKKEKTDLMDSRLHTKALAFLFASCDADADAQSKTPMLQGVTFRSCMRYAHDTASNGAPLMKQTQWGDWSAVGLRDAILEWVQAAHARMDQEAGAFAPPGSNPLALTLSVAADRTKLGVAADGAAGAATGWCGVNVLSREYITRDATPLRVSLRKRAAGRSGSVHAIPCTVRCFVTRGAPDDELAKATTAMAVVDEWDAAAPALLEPLFGADALVQHSDTIFTRPMRLELRGARVIPVDELVAMEAFKVLNEIEYQADVKAAEGRKPARIASVPNMHSDRAAGLRSLVAAPPFAALDADDELPLRWCVAVVRGSASDIAEGRDLDSKFVFLDTTVTLKLTIASCDAEGNVQARTAPLETSTTATRCYDERAATDRALAAFGTGKARHGAGLYFFEPQTFHCLRRAGYYRLSFSIATPSDGAIGGVRVAPLVTLLQRRAPRLRRALDAGALWKACCHADADACRAPRGQAGACLELAEAKKAGRTSLALGGAPVGMSLFLKQRTPAGIAVGWPADEAALRAALLLTVWDTNGDDQQTLPIKVLPLRAADVAVSADGLVLELKNVRIDAVPGQRLPSGDKLDAENALDHAGRGRGCALTCLLRMSVAGALVAENKIDIFGGVEIPLQVLPGVASKLVYLSGDGIWSADGAEHAPGVVLTLRVGFVDKYGNATRSFDGVADARGAALKLELAGLARVREGDIALEANGENAGAATFQLRVTARFGEPFSVAVRSAAVRSPERLQGVAPARELRIVKPRRGDTPLTGEAGTPCVPLAEVRALVCVPGTSHADATFTGRLLLSAGPGAPEEWTAALSLALLTEPIVAGEAKLPAIKLPQTPGRVALLVRLEHAPEATAQIIQLDVYAPAPAKLLAAAAALDVHARAGEPLQLRFSARSAEGMPTPVTEVLLQALHLVNDDDGNGVEITHRELLRGGADGAALTVRLACAAGDVRVKACVPAHEDEDDEHACFPAMEVSWQICLEAGPPQKHESSPCILAQGATLTTHDVAFTDADGNGCGSELNGAELELETPPWLQADAGGSGSGGGGVFSWVVREGIATLTALFVARGAPVGVHQLDARLLAPPAALTGAARAGTRRGGRAAAAAGAQRAKLLDFPLIFDIRAGRHAALLALPSAAVLQVEALAPLSGLFGTVFALDASGARAAAEPTLLPFLELLLLPAGEAAFDPRLQRAWVRVAPTPGEAGGAYDCDAVAMTAAARAGDYWLHLRLAASAAEGGPPVVTQRQVRILPAAFGPLQCVFADPAALPKYVAAGAAEGAADGVFAVQLDVLFTDAHGNLVDVSRALPPRTLRLRWERAGAAAAGAAPLEQPPLHLVKREGADAEHVAAARHGRVSFYDVRALPSWASGRYALFVDVHPEGWLPPPAHEFSACASHEFEYISAEDAEADGERRKQLAEAEGALQAAEAELQRATAALSAMEGGTREARHAADAAVERAQLRRVEANGAAAAAVAATAVVGAERAAGAVRPSLTFTDDGAPAHVAQYMRRNAQGVKYGHLPVHAGGLGASLALNSDVLCMAAELLRGETPAICEALCRAAGARELGMVIVRNEAGAARCRAQLQRSLCLLRLHNAAVQATYFRGQIMNHPQRLLSFGQDWTSAPGCLGYLVNLVHLTEQQLATMVAVPAPVPARTPQPPQAAGRAPPRTPPAATPLPPRLYGLRESVLYSIFGSALLFDSDASMAAFEVAHPAAALAHTLRSLIGRSVSRNGREYGEGAFSTPRFFTLPCASWDERVQSTALWPLHAALRKVAAAEAAARAADEADEASLADAAAEQNLNATIAALRGALTERQAAARAAHALAQRLRAEIAASAGAAARHEPPAATGHAAGRRR